MENKIKTVLLGQYTDAPWHPLDAVEEELVTALGDGFDVTCTEDMDALTAARLADTGLLVSYTDCWNKPAAPDQVGGLLGYVSGGGALLVVHSGISLQANYELLHLIGAKFTGHPPYRTLNVDIAAPGHDIVRGMEPFAINDEPYEFDELPYFEKELLLTYKDNEGHDRPAAWTHRYGMGRVVYIALGHDVTAFRNESLRQLIARSARWLTASA